MQRIRARKWLAAFALIGVLACFLVLLFHNRHGAVPYTGAPLSSEDLLTLMGSPATAAQAGQTPATAGRGSDVKIIFRGPRGEIPSSGVMRAYSEAMMDSVAYGPILLLADGSATLPNCPPLPLTIIAYVPGYEAERVEDIRLSSDRPTVVPLTPAEAIKLHILDAQTKKPVQGATAHFENAYMPSAWVRLLGGAEDRRSRQTPLSLGVCARSDSNGYAAITMIPAAKSCRFFVQAPGYAPAWAPRTAAAWVGDAVVVELQPPVVISGDIRASEDILAGTKMQWVQRFLDYQTGTVVTKTHEILIAPEGGHASFKIENPLPVSVDVEVRFPNRLPVLFRMLGTSSASGIAVTLESVVGLPKQARRLEIP